MSTPASTGGRGVGRAPALLVIDVNRRLHRPGVAARVRPRRRRRGDPAAARRVRARAELPVVYTTVSYGEGDKADGGGVHRQGPARCSRSRRAAAGSRSTTRIAPRPERAGAEQALRVRVLRDAVREPARLARVRQRRSSPGASTSGLRPRDGRSTCSSTGYRPGRAARGGRRPKPGGARGAALYDIDLKYGDVVSLGECVDGTWRSLAGAHTLVEKILLAHCDADDVRARRRRHRPLRRRDGERRLRPGRVPARWRRWAPTASSTRRASSWSPTTSCRRRTRVGRAPARA